VGNAPVTTTIFLIHIVDWHEQHSVTQPTPYWKRTSRRITHDSAP
jgi:hypothetical protein